ncbi:MAG: hypothetical protein Q9201_003045 [Fulgogasparrea decipioides]
MFRLRGCPLVAAISVLSIFVYGAFQPSARIAHSVNSANTAALVHQNTGQIIKKVALPFGDYLRYIPSDFPPNTEGGTPNLAKRAYPNTLTYADALCKGQRYWATIQAGNPDPPRFTQTNFDESGWTENSGFPQVIPDDLKTPVDSLGLLQDRADVRRIAAQQYSEFTNQNGQRQDDPSGGQYLQVYIPSKGTIIANENISPQQSIAMYRRDNKLPPYTAAQYKDFIPEMHRWSDVVWFMWTKQAGNQAGNLRYIFRDNVINNDTKSVIDQVFKIPSYSFDLKWPGETFDVATTDDGKALLGTPHGAGIAWMLADNRDVLGESGLKITCFSSDGYFKGENGYYMLFELTRAQAGGS